MPNLIPVDFNPFASSQDQEGISSIESGGNYRSIGPMIIHGSMSGQRALGKYQVMESNVGPWTEEALGKRLTPQEFLADNNAQDATFNHKFGQYKAKYGPEGAARAWFAGEGGMNDPNRRDQLGTTVQKYGQMFSAKTRENSSGPKLVPIDFDPFAQTQEAPTSFADRFVTPTPPQQNTGDLRYGLQDRATAMMRGAPVSPMQSSDIAQSNILPAASQGTSPNPSDYNGRLVSKETFQSDSGEILYRDPVDGQVKPTNTKTQVAIRDPADNTVKIFDRSEATNEGSAVGVSRVLAPGLASGAPTARALITAPSKAATVKASDIFSTAKAPYRQFDELAANSAQAGTKDTAERIAAALEKGNQPTTFPGPKYIQDTVNAITKEGEYVTVDKLRDLKERLGGSFKSADNRERAAASIASREISKIISEAAPEASASLQKADSIFSTAKDMQSLQRARDLSGLRAGRTGYGGNEVNTMRQEIGKILDKITRGGHTTLKPDEIAAMREIDQGTNMTNAARLVGQMSPSKGIIQTGIGISTAGITAAIGAAANKLATVLTGRQIDQLMEKVAKRSPEYSKAVSKAVDRWQRTQAEMASDPSPAKFAAYISSSRALSAGLTRDGIQVTSGDLLKAIQGPMKSAAEPDQPSVDGRPSQ